MTHGYEMDVGDDPKAVVNQNKMTTLKKKIEKKFEFSEHEAYYRLGYDSEKEPGVKFIIEGARGEFNQIKSEVLPILLECVEALEGYKDQFDYRTGMAKATARQALDRLRKWSEG